MPVDGILARGGNVFNAHEARHGGGDVAQGEPRSAGVTPYGQLPTDDEVIHGYVMLWCSLSSAFQISLQRYSKVAS